MQILPNLLGVIFMLSTIVTVTDCCSSRFLLLREHTLRLVNQHKFHRHDDDLHLIKQHQPQIQQKLQQHVDVGTNIDFQNNHTIFSRGGHKETSKSSNAEDSTDVSPSYPNFVNATEILPTDQPPDQLTPESNSSSRNPDLDEKSNDFITDPTVREEHAGNPKYHIIDFYYTIMRDVLSFECGGLFLTDFCLNGGRCFRYPVGNHSFFSCECADGYVGERCESKSLNEIFVPATPTLDAQKPKVLMARIVFSFPMLIAISAIYLLFGALIVFKRPSKSRVGN